MAVDTVQEGEGGGEVTAAASAFARDGAEVDATAEA